MKIEVSEQDIAKGMSHVGSDCGCPIWRAISRKLHLPTEIKLNPLRFEYYEEANLGNLLFELPEEAVEWQHEAIAKRHAEPITFEATLIEKEASDV